MKTALRQGFTLIELIVVMAVIAILAGIVLVGLNPVEQTRKATDASRTETTAKLGEAVLRYQIARGVLPTVDATWQTTLLNNNDIKAVASNGGTCPSNSQGGYCYLTDGATPSVDFIVYTRAESGASKTQGGCTSTQQAWLIYSSTAQKTGVGCTTNPTTAPAYNIVLDNVVTPTP